MPDATNTPADLMLKDRKTPVAMRWSKPCQKSTPDPFLLQYRYDASGNLVQLIYPDSQTVSYDYDARERLVSITDWNARLTTLEWDEAGRLLKVTRPNGTYREYQYDGAGRLLQIAERKASKRAICLVRFELDAAGRPTKKLTLPLPQPASVAGFTATHNADNQIAGVPYDADGNLQSTYLPLSWFPVAEMAWDTRNRLSQIWEEVWDGEAFVGYYQSQFVYDAEGHRTHQTNGGQTTRYTVNPHGLSGLSEVLIEHKPNNTQRRYLWGGPAGLLYEIQTDSSGAETSVRYYHSDQAGSTLALTDSAGEVTGRAEYTPYGVISHTSGVMDTPYLFNGAYGVQTDFQTGLIHMRARYYHPWLGRFISEDPIQFDGGNNWYAYADGDPLMKMDPLGLDAWTSTMGGLRMVGGAFEVVAGYSLATASAAFGAGTSWTGVGLVAGGAGVVGGVAVGGHGIDTFQAGMRQMWSGQNVDSVTSIALQSAGMSPRAANLTDAGIGVVGSFGAGFAATGFRAASLSATAAPGVASASLLTKIKYYEAGQTSFPGTVFNSTYANIPNTLDRGAQILADYGSLWGVARAGSSSLGYAEGTLKYLPTPMANGSLGSIFTGAAYLGGRK